MSESSAAQPAMSESSAAQPPTYAVIAWCNVGWQSTRFNQLKRHEQTLHKDLWEAVGKEVAGVIMLC